MKSISILVKMITKKFILEYLKLIEKNWIRKEGYYSDPNDKIDRLDANFVDFILEHGIDTIRPTNDGWFSVCSSYGDFEYADSFNKNDIDYLTKQKIKNFLND